MSVRADTGASRGGGRVAGWRGAAHHHPGSLLTHKSSSHCHGGLLPLPRCLDYTGKVLYRINMLEGCMYVWIGVFNTLLIDDGLRLPQTLAA